ncbi:hypothetical protein [Mycobacterium uberis]|uniref:hypothetical protein n=1 Tax=Mycobacterium uberis TaxID=2162698 RepID=UPI001401D851|nr:hypothetical protein [Mycobacterium uberis]
MMVASRLQLSSSPLTSVSRDHVIGQLLPEWAIVVDEVDTSGARLPLGRRTITG